MTLRITDLLDYASAEVVGTTTAGTPFTQSKVSLGRYVGTYKSIDSVYTGKFVPGEYRVNPVVIKSGVGISTKGYVGTTAHKAGVGSSLYYGDCTLLNTSLVQIPFGTWSTTLANEASLNAFAAMNDASAEVGVILGELRETIAMIRHPLRSLVKNLNAFKRELNRARLLGASKNLTNAVVDQTLMTKYGILPLIKDIVDLQTAFHERLRNESLVLRRARYRMVGVEKHAIVYNTTHPLVPLTTYPRPTCMLLGTEVRETSYTAVAYYQHLLDIDARLTLGHWGLDQSQMLSTMWELVPWSFVVDWFWNFGLWLRALRPSRNIERFGGCVSCKTTITRTYALHRNPYGYVGVTTNRINSYSDCSYTWHSETLERRLITSSLGFPSLNIVPDVIREHITELLLLMWQAGSGRLR